MERRLESTQSDRFLNEYTDELVSVWDDYIDWEARDATEGDFFSDLLRKHGAKRVLDAACGTGFHAIKLQRAGFDVDASDGSPNMVEKAQENAKEHGCPDLDVRVADWQTLSDTFGANKYDAVTCLGNSFTHLHGEESQKAALAGMAAVLRPGGLLVIDQRNYDRMLDKKDEPSHEFYYSGDAVEGVAAEVSEKLVRFECVTNEGDAFDLMLNPVRQDTLTRLLDESGFDVVERFGDFKAPYEKYAPEFVVQAARKRGTVLDRRDLT